MPKTISEWITFALIGVAWIYVVIFSLTHMYDQATFFLALIIYMKMIKEK